MKFNRRNVVKESFNYCLTKSEDIFLYSFTKETFFPFNDKSLMAIYDKDLDEAKAKFNEDFESKNIVFLSILVDQIKSTISEIAQSENRAYDDIINELIIDTIFRNDLISLLTNKENRILNTLMDMQDVEYHYGNENDIKEIYTHFNKINKYKLYEKMNDSSTLIVYKNDSFIASVVFLGGGDVTYGYEINFDESGEDLEIERTETNNLDKEVSFISGTKACIYFDKETLKVEQINFYEKGRRCSENMRAKYYVALGYVIDALNVFAKNKKIKNLVEPLNNETIIIRDKELMIHPSINLYKDGDLIGSYFNSLRKTTYKFKEKFNPSRYVFMFNCLRARIGENKDFQDVSFGLICFDYDTKNIINVVPALLFKEKSFKKAFKKFISGLAKPSAIFCVSDIQRNIFSKFLEQDININTLGSKERDTFIDLSERFISSLNSDETFFA